jgi:hypothetical protein
VDQVGPSVLNAIVPGLFGHSALDWTIVKADYINYELSDMRFRCI